MSKLVKTPLIDGSHSSVTWPTHPLDEGKYHSTLTHKDSGTKVHVAHLHEDSEHSGSIYYTTVDGTSKGKVSARAEVRHYDHETNSHDPHFSFALTEPEHRGKGLNTLIHVAALKDYGSLKSDYRLSPGSQKMYEKLAQHPNVSAQMAPTETHFDDEKNVTIFPQETQHELEYRKKPKLQQQMSSDKKLAASELTKAPAAYHGSKFDFDQFSTDFSGSNQGNASGHGTYFADKPEGAKFYATLGQKTGTGGIYVADIPEQHHFMSYHDPISAHPKHIAEAMRSTPSYKAHVRKYKKEPHKYLNPEQLNGSQIYNNLSNHGMDPKQSSDYLHSIGIKGIKRKEGKEHHFIVFNTKDIKMLQTPKKLAASELQKAPVEYETGNMSTKNFDRKFKTKGVEIHSQNLSNGLVYKQHQYGDDFIHEIYHPNVEHAIVQVQTRAVGDENPSATQDHKVTWSEVHPEYKGQGLGKQAYNAILVHGKGVGRLTSDNEISPRAHKMWQGLVQQSGVSGKLAPYMTNKQYEKDDNPDRYADIHSQTHQAMLPNKKDIDQSKLFPPVNFGAKVADKLAASEKSMKIKAFTKSEPINHKQKIQGPHMIFSAENPMHPVKVQGTHKEVLSSLQHAGEDAHEVQGKYGKPEKSIIVYQPKSPEHIAELAHSLGQDSHIESDGTNHLIHYNHGEKAGQADAASGTVFHDHEPDNNYTKLPDGTIFTYRF